MVQGHASQSVWLPFCSGSVLTFDVHVCAATFVCLISSIKQVSHAQCLCRLLGRNCRVVYVESIARVATLSLSGWLLYSSGLADAIFVQWPELQAKYPHSTYAGRVF